MKKKKYITRAEVRADMDRLRSGEKINLTRGHLYGLMRDAEADRAKGPGGAAKARRANGHADLAKLLADGIKATWAAEDRRWARIITPEERAADEVAVLEALPVANLWLGPGEPNDAEKAPFIAGWIGISPSRVEKVIRSIGLHKGIHPGSKFGLPDTVVSRCPGCAAAGAERAGAAPGLPIWPRPRGCLEHVRPEVLFAAFKGRKLVEYVPRRQKRAGVRGLPSYSTVLDHLDGARLYELRERYAREPRGGYAGELRERSARAQGRIDHAIAGLIDNIPRAERAAEKSRNARQEKRADRGAPAQLNFSYRVPARRFGLT